MWAAQALRQARRRDVRTGKSRQRCLAGPRATALKRPLHQGCRQHRVQNVGGELRSCGTRSGRVCAACLGHLDRQRDEALLVQHHRGCRCARTRKCGICGTGVRRGGRGGGRGDRGRLRVERHGGGGVGLCAGGAWWLPSGRWRGRSAGCSPSRALWEQQPPQRRMEHGGRATLQTRPGVLWEEPWARQRQLRPPCWGPPRRRSAWPCWRPPSPPGASSRPKAGRRQTVAAARARDVCDEPCWRADCPSGPPRPPLTVRACSRRREATSTMLRRRARLSAAWAAGREWGCRTMPRARRCRKHARAGAGCRRPACAREPPRRRAPPRQRHNCTAGCRRSESQHQMASHRACKRAGTAHTATQTEAKQQRTR